MECCLAAALGFYEGCAAAPAEVVLLRLRYMADFAAPAGVDWGELGGYEVGGWWRECPVGGLLCGEVFLYEVVLEGCGALVGDDAREVDMVDDRLGEGGDAFGRLRHCRSGGMLVKVNSPKRRR